MYLTIIILPLLGSIISGFLGRKTGVSGAQMITCLSIIAVTICAIVAFLEVGLNSVPVSINLIRWIDSESLNVFWGLQFDSLTVSMLIPVLIVSSLVHIYSIGYMSHDPHQQRFFSYLSLFTFMMIILVTANNYLLMFVGWEGVGVCSYLLVSFWFTRIAANQSSISAFLTNRVGDCFLTIGMFAILWSFGNVDYSTVFSLAPFINENIVTIIGICLLIGAMAKSSQIGLHIWLPMAMEGPTPVSALIHAATMVTAGVYLLMRSSPLIEYSPTVLLLCLWLGAITTVFSSLIGLLQQDIKKVIAYSTMSQLGMMVIAVGLSSYNVALFHLVNHAFYKALLFLGAGSVIHAVADNQDFRKYGGLISHLPLTYSVMFIASLSLVAFPFMTGFYSKDFILESAYGGFTHSGIVVYYIATVGAIFTTLYSVKVLYLTFITKPNGPRVYYKENISDTVITNNHIVDFKDKNSLEGEIFMNLPLIILAIFSILFGYISKDIFIGLASMVFADNSLFIRASQEIMLDTEFAVNTVYKLLPLGLTILFSFSASIFSEYYGKTFMIFKFSRLSHNILCFLNQRFFVELLYYKCITGLILFKAGKHTGLVLDKGSVEFLGPYGLEKSAMNLSKNIDNLSTGVVTNYALYIFAAFLFYISLPLAFKYYPSYCILFIWGLLLLINVNIMKLQNDITIELSDKQSPEVLNTVILKSGFFFWRSDTQKKTKTERSALFFNTKNIFKHFTVLNIAVGISIILIILPLRFVIIPFIIHLCNWDLSDMLLWLTSGVVSLFIRLSIKGVIECMFTDLFMHIDVSPNKPFFDLFKGYYCKDSGDDNSDDSSKDASGSDMDVDSQDESNVQGIQQGGDDSSVGSSNNDNGSDIDMDSPGQSNVQANNPNDPGSDSDHWSELDDIDNVDDLVEADPKLLPDDTLVKYYYEIADLVEKEEEEQFEERYDELWDEIRRRENEENNTHIRDLVDSRDKMDHRIPRVDDPEEGETSNSSSNPDNHNNQNSDHHPQASSSNNDNQSGSNSNNDNQSGSNSNNNNQSGNNNNN